MTARKTRSLEVGQGTGLRVVALGVPASVQVRIGESGVMCVQVSGPADVVDHMKIELGDCDRVLIVDTRTAPADEADLVRAAAAQRAAGHEEVHVVVELPTGTRVLLHGTKISSCEIGDTGASAELHVIGAAEVVVGRVPEAFLELAGTLNVAIAEAVAQVCA